MAKTKLDWKKYEAELIACIEIAVRGAMDEYPDEHFCGAALHHFYRESGEVIAMPCLAVNTEEELDEHNRWSSPDWYWEQLPFASRKFGQLHERLNKEANSIDRKYWTCLLYTSPSPRDQRGSRMPSSA